jgi:NADP-dependent 3-hydroxy acid dehydrogenase YdfG
MDWDNRPTAVVCGATGGIGRAIVRQLSSSHRLWLMGRNLEQLDLLAADCEAARSWVLDLDAIGDQLLAPADITEVDVLVLCAGVWAGGPARATPAGTWRDVFEVNVFGQVALTRALLDGLRAACGRVVIISSTALRGTPANRAAYTASKAALEVFGRALHEEERDRGVQVGVVYAGRVATDMQRAVRRSERGQFRPQDYLPPSAIAQAVAALLDAAPSADIAEMVVRPRYQPTRPVGTPPAPLTRTVARR